MHKTTCNPDKSDLFLSEDFLGFVTGQKNSSKELLKDFVVNHCFSQSFFQKIDYQYNDYEIYLISITHTSLVHEFPELKLASNQRLEYLGDAVIDLLMASVLVNTYPHFQEGKLSKLRSALVNELSLAMLSNIIGLNRIILLGKGELLTRGYLKSSMLSDVFESLLGGIFEDSGFVGVQRVFFKILDLYEEQFDKKFISDDVLDEFDPKSRLQELTMAMGMGLPQYQNRETSDKQFKIDLMIKDKVILSKTGPAKKQVERDLAYNVLKNKLYL